MKLQSYNMRTISYLGAIITVPTGGWLIVHPDGQISWVSIKPEIHCNEQNWFVDYDSEWIYIGKFDLNLEEDFDWQETLLQVPA